MTKDLVNDVWPYASALEVIRKKAGNLSVERAAGRIGASRSSWNAWEAGTRRPAYENLHAIVEAFHVPPEMIGFEAPTGWELVPAEWLRTEFAKLDEILEYVKPK